MDKTIKISVGNILTMIILLVAIIGAFTWNQIDIYYLKQHEKEQDTRLEKGEVSDKEQAKAVAEFNTKQNLMYEDVKFIKNAIMGGAIHPN